MLILGSRSPRRLELLSLLIPKDQIRVVAAPDEREPGFDGIDSESEIRSRLAEIARLKNDAVRKALGQDPWQAVLTADTVIIATNDAGKSVVLGKPDGTDWQQTVRDWFRNYYLGRTHQVATAVCVRVPNGTSSEFTVFTSVEMVECSDELLEWYIETQEPLGKAGGYGLQGAADIFVSRIDGSPSNIIGLPLRETLRAFHDLGLMTNRGAR